MARTPTGTRNKMIHCDICGEDYAATYKRCPFCDGRPPQEEGDAPRRRSSRRMTTNTRGGGYSSGPTPTKIITTVISLALIVAAVCIVVSIIKPMIDRGNPTPPPSPTPPPTESVSPSPETPPSPTVPADQTATGFTLDKSDFTLQNYGQTETIHAVFSPANSVGYLEWTSSAPNVVSVDENGTVKGIGKSGGVGSATITATLKGTQISQSCIVRCSFDAPADAGTSTPSAQPSTAPNAALSLNRSDFTLSATYPKFQVVLSGTTSTPSWSVSNPAIATVDSSGTVTRVGIGTTTLICKVDGQELTCIVRCS